MDLQLLISGIIFGLSIGSVYFLLAIGLSLCFGLMRIISLDQLLYYSVGAFISYTVFFQRNCRVKLIGWSPVTFPGRCLRMKE